MAVGIVSYLYSLGPLARPLMPYPLDYLAMAAVSLGIYFLGVITAYEKRDLRLVKERGLPLE